MSIGSGDGRASGPVDTGATAGPAPSLSDSLNESLDETQAYLKQQWQDRPLLIAGLVVAAGLLIGLALRRR
ncbi:MAG TPA: hypothetical protein VEA80_16335 [Vitreimonas sp.]|uniref:hypothetical protein n=1 Tax=Vitreimonas sp. TaxID=3069702 RepID=UPI002D2E9233|nr:hypothetical protein [Vitreimonas sp.]HYD89046.1 hypothetical protein [Vitreimonas sp.]